MMELVYHSCFKILKKSDSKKLERVKMIYNLVMKGFVVTWGLN